MSNDNSNAEELKEKFKDAIGHSDFHVPEFISGIPMADGSVAYTKVLIDETDSLANECVKITNEAIAEYREGCEKALTDLLEDYEKNKHKMTHEDYTNRRDITFHCLHEIQSAFINQQNEKR